MPRPVPLPPLEWMLECVPQPTFCGATNTPTFADCAQEVVLNETTATGNFQVRSLPPKVCTKGR